MNYYVKTWIARLFIFISIVAFFGPLYFPDSWKYKDVWKITSNVNVSQVKYDCSCGGAPTPVYTLGFKYIDKNGKPGEIKTLTPGQRINKKPKFTYDHADDSKIYKIRETKTVYLRRTGFYVIWYIFFVFLFIFGHTFVTYPRFLGRKGLKIYMTDKFAVANDILRFFGYEIEGENVPEYEIENCYKYDSDDPNELRSMGYVMDVCKKYNLKKNPDEA